MIEYKKILHYIMMLKSAYDTEHLFDYPQSNIYEQHCYDMLNNGYFNDEENKWLLDHFNFIFRNDFRNLIDDIFKIMGIYKEPYYIVE